MQARGSRTTIRRDTDRRITAGGLAVSAAFVGLAVVTTLLPTDVRRGAWLPLHLALPGGATIAIGAVLPFFVAALAAARPGPPAVRVATLVLLGSGAAGVSLGVVGGSAPIATGGGLLFVAGLLCLGALLLVILGGALGSQRGLLPRAYGIAIANVTVGASIATLYVAGFGPVVEYWARLKPAHAWLNLFGFVGLVIAATLVHLYPTVAGTRIVVRATAKVALGGLAAGPPVIAAGYALGIDGLARMGALIVVAGAVALLAFIGQVHRGRGTWTTEVRWHRFATWSLGAGVSWYAVGVVLAAGGVIAHGTASESWAIAAIAAPLVPGFVLQVLVGAWTHLLPAVGPGDQRLHARQRSTLATAAYPRIVALNAGALFLAIGLPAGSTALVVAGALAVGSVLLADLALFARALAIRFDTPAGAVRQAGQGGT